ncbi:hypothetical protein M426DRAFT_265179 [Hypoxylon sp. CI-4A]|nr:hypothetical protein M426DRAFT_265179 [Hypoxylon sp. CI-4A]
MLSRYVLDEADVLLCKRNSAEIDRNAIVAVSLRMIEYFQGVLSLTTKRKSDFDEAFKSRIHVTIPYPDLTENARSGIWKQLLDRNEKISKDLSWNDDIFEALGKLDMNVRVF